MGVTGTGLYGYDTITLGGLGDNGPFLDHHVVAGMATKEFYTGLFGLSPHSTILPNPTAPVSNYISQLNRSCLIPS